MTLDAADSLVFGIGELMRADMRVATFIHGSTGDPQDRAAAILEAIAEREQVAAAVLAAIAREDRALQSGMTGDAAPAEDGPDPGAQLLRRDRKIEALVGHIESQSWEFSRVARRLETALRDSRPGPGWIRL